MSDNYVKVLSREKMKILVTGAAGFLGQNLAAKLAQRGDEVTAMVWPPGSGAGLQELPLRILTGSILDPEAVARAVAGQDAVYHIAGKVDDWGPRDEYYAVNVQGTRALLGASLAAGIKHFLHISSLVVLGIPEKNPLDETTAYTGTFQNPYMETKLLSEIEVREFGAARGFPVTIIRPGIIWGPGDTTMLPRMERLAKLRLLVPVGRGDALLCLTHVANLTEALVLMALNEKAYGQIYHITDAEAVSSKRYFKELSRVIGIRQPPVCVPQPLACFAADVFEIAARLLGLLGKQCAPLLTRYGISVWSASMVAPPAKAEQQLGYRQQVFFREGMHELAGWYGRRGSRGI